MAAYEFDGLKFDWDDDKYKINVEKHGIYFEEAASAFVDDNAVILPDDAHSYREERFMLIGFSRSNKLLTVCHCERQNGEVTRIISARRAEHIEIILYNRGG